VIGPFARRRLALGVAPAVVPAGAWLLLGVAAGPSGLGALTADVLAHLDAVVTVALGTLGVFVGLALAPRVTGAWRLLTAAIVESGATAAIVAGAATVLFRAWHLPLAGAPAVIVLALGAAAAASSAGAADEGRTDASAVSVDDLLPILLAAAACGLTTPAGIGAAAAVGAAVAIGTVVGVVGWLLFERTGGDAERGVFVIGVLSLIGGVAAYANVSPLVAGLVSGLLWRRAPGNADTIVAADLRRFHHPLVVLLLVVAGAQMRLTPVALFLLAAFVVFRLAGKVIGGVLASRLTRVPGDLLGALLVSPGVIGIAIALNIQQVAPADGTPLVTAVAAGTLLFEILALLLPREAAA